MQSNIMSSNPSERLPSKLMSGLHDSDRSPLKNVSPSRGDSFEPILPDNDSEAEEQKYFAADSNEKPEKVQNPADDEYELKCPTTSARIRTEIIFKPKFFLKTLIDHLLFFLVLGPFIYFYGLFTNVHRMRNQGFLPAKDPNFFIQTAIWLFVVQSTLIFFLVGHDENIDISELLMTYFAVFIRCVFIAVKYGYMSDDYLKAFENRTLTVDEMATELMVNRWRSQGDNVIEQELQANILSEDIDASLFYFNFITKCCPELEKKLSKNSDLIKIREHKLVPVKNFSKKMQQLLKFDDSNVNRLEYLKNLNQRLAKSDPQHHKGTSEESIQNASKMQVPKPSPRKSDAVAKAAFQLIKVKNSAKSATDASGERPNKSVFHQEASPQNNLLVKKETSHSDEKDTSAIQKKHIDQHPEAVSNKDVELVFSPQAEKSNNVTVDSAPLIDIDKLKDEEKLQYQAHDIVGIAFRKFLSKGETYFGGAKKLFGYCLAIDMVKQTKSLRLKREGWITLAIAIIRAFLPSIYRAYQKYRYDESIAVFGESHFDKYLVASLMIANIYFFWANYVVACQSLSDYRVKRYLMLQLGNLLSVRKLIGFNIKKLYPTLNIFDNITVKTWVNLRKILWKYGAKYQIRQDLDLTVYTVLYVIIILILMLQWLKLVTVPLSTMAMILFSYECFFVSILFVQVLILAAQINDTFQLHMNVLKKIKLVSGDLLYLDYAYFNKDVGEAENYIYKAGVRMLKKELGGEGLENDPEKAKEFFERLERRLSKLISLIDEEIEDLEFEFTNNPYKIVGFRVDWQLLTTAAVAGLSAVIGIIQRQL